MSEISIIGAGAWGTALAIVLGRKGAHSIRFWAHEKEVCESIARRRVNELFLPGMSIPQNVCPTNDLEAALRGAQIIVSAMPSQTPAAMAMMFLSAPPSSAPTTSSLV